MSQINSLYVNVDLGNGEIVLAGQLGVDRRQRMGVFRYANKYCDHPDAYPLDPINLPLKKGAVYESPITREHLGIAGVLLDAGPDDWGQKVLISLLNPPPSNELEFLLSGSGQGVGTIYFTEKRNTRVAQADMQLLPSFEGENYPEIIEEYSLNSLAPEFSSLEDILETAMAIDTGLDVPREKAMFFRSGSSIGGVRPKAFVDEPYTAPNGDTRWQRWIVKFPRRGELVDQCLLEYASMQMASDAGIRVPETKVLQTQLGALLLVERFDIDKEVGGRAHLISFQSLVNVQEVAKMNSDNISYPNLGKICKQISDDGESENKEVFRRMLFNIAIGNVDDHPKNHSFMKPAGTKRYNLTPAYDVLPTIGMDGGVQAMGLSPMGPHQSQDNLALCAEQMGIDEDEASEMAAAVLDATEDWEEYMEGLGLGEKERQIIGKSLKARQAVKTYLDTLTTQQRERAARQGMTLGM